MALPHDGRYVTQPQFKGQNKRQWELYDDRVSRVHTLESWYTSLRDPLYQETKHNRDLICETIKVFKNMQQQVDQHDGVLIEARAGTS